MSKGYDPILLEHHDVNTWISETDDNFVLVLPNNNNYKEHNILLKKSYFLNPQVNDFYLECDIKNDALMVDQTNKSKLYRNIGYFFGKYTMIDEKELIKNLKKKKNIFEVKISDKTLDLPTFINQEVLLLTQIGLFKSLAKGDEKKKINKLFKKNMPYKEEVYFNELISKALFNYSTLWDKPINTFLRKGVSYYDTPEFINTYNMIYYSNILTNIAFIKKTKKEDFKEQIKKDINEKIEAIDKCFMEMAPRNQNDTKIYYRGMKNSYDFDPDSKEVIVRNFTSVSTKPNVSVGFSDRSKGCCIYELQIDKGIPLINMITTTKYKNENETLLPRDLIFKIIGSKTKQYKIGGLVVTYEIQKLKVSKMRPDQFTIDTGCKKYPVFTITPLKNLVKSPDKKLKKQKSKKNVKVLSQVPENIEENLKPAKPVKKPRCPKGSRRDKKTGMCLDKNGNVVVNVKDPIVPKEIKKPKQKTIKKPRCPNGQRRNKKTGLCEPK